MSRRIVTRWYGTFLLEGARTIRTEEAPVHEAELERRVRERRSGALTPEEERLLGGRGSEEWTTADRRLVRTGVAWAPRAGREEPGRPSEEARAARRRVLLAAADQDLHDAWDPSIHLEEAVRAATDLDRVRNLVGERLASWVSRDAPEVDPGDHARAARVLLEESAPSALGPTDAAVRDARRKLAELYRSIESTEEALKSAASAAIPLKTPNLNALLGPELAARMLAQARGLDRLARLPASTIQVLGAERAFFEHLRGNAPPPRHGILFLHPAIQSASRRERGKLARTLAGKVAIAARLDRAGKPVDPALARAFEGRRARLKEARTGAGPRPRPRRSR